MTKHEELVAFVREHLTPATAAQVERAAAGYPDIPDLRDPERKASTIIAVDGEHFLVPDPRNGGESAVIHETVMRLRREAQAEAEGGQS